MIPHLSPLDGSTGLEGGSRTVAVPPPLHFRALQGTPREISLRTRTYKRATGLTAAQRSGLRYEEHAQRFLIETLPHNYEAAPFIHFEDALGFRTCIPDGLLIADKHAVLVEIKKQHMADAWWQLDQLYKPLIENFTKRPVSLLEVCHLYDPYTPFPCQFDLVTDLKNWVSQHQTKFGVFVWKP